MTRQRPNPSSFPGKSSPLPLGHSARRRLKRPQRQLRHRRLLLEALEARTLLSVTPGDVSSFPSEFIRFQGADEQNPAVYFAAQDGIDGQEIWKYEGSSAVKALNIGPGNEGSGPQELTVIGDTLYFSAYHPDHGRELWTSDGTQANTRVVDNIVAGPESSFPQLLTNVNGTLYFLADDGVHGEELWKLNDLGQAVLVKDIFQGNVSSDSGRLTAVGDSLFFTSYDYNPAANTTYGHELWVSDGSETGTYMVSDIRPGAESSYPEQFTVLNGDLYFSADDGTNGRQLGKAHFNGAAWVTERLTDSDGYVGDLDVVNGQLMFTTLTPIDEGAGTGGLELWKLDGTTPRKVAGIHMGERVDTGLIVTAGDHLMLSILFLQESDGSYDATRGWELWAYNEADGLTLIQSFDRVGDLFDPLSLTAVAETVFFANYDASHGQELWQASRNAGSWTSGRLTDINSSVGHSFPQFLTRVGDALYFSADDGFGGVEPWKAQWNGAEWTVAQVANIGDLVQGPDPAQQIQIELAFSSDSGYEDGDRLTAINQPTFFVTVDHDNTWIGVDFNGDGTFDEIRHAALWGTQAFTRAVAFPDGKHVITASILESYEDHTPILTDTAEVTIDTQRFTLETSAPWAAVERRLTFDEAIALPTLRDGDFMLSGEALAEPVSLTRFSWADLTDEEIAAEGFSIDLSLRPEDLGFELPRGWYTLTLDPTIPDLAGNWIDPDSPKEDTFYHMPDVVVLRADQPGAVVAWDTSYEGKDLVVDGVTLEVPAGPHSLASLFVLNGGLVQPDQDGSILDLTVVGEVYVDANSSIDDGDAAAEGDSNLAAFAAQDRTESRVAHKQDISSPQGCVREGQLWRSIEQQNQISFKRLKEGSYRMRRRICLPDDRRVANPNYGGSRGDEGRPYSARTAVSNAAQQVSGPRFEWTGMGDGRTWHDKKNWDVLPSANQRTSYDGYPVYAGQDHYLALSSGFAHIPGPSSLGEPDRVIVVNSRPGFSNAAISQVDAAPGTEIVVDTNLFVYGTSVLGGSFIVLPGRSVSALSPLPGPGPNPTPGGAAAAATSQQTPFGIGHLTVLGPTTVDGASLSAIRGGTMDLDQATSFTGGLMTISGGGSITATRLADIDNSRFELSDGAKLQPIASSYSATGIRNGATLFSVDGTGTELDLSALLSFDDGGDLGWGGPQVHTVAATGGGAINLSNVRTVIGPAESSDRLDFLSDRQAGIDLRGLQTTESKGQIRFQVTASDPQQPWNLGSLVSAQSATFDVPAGSTYQTPELLSAERVVINLGDGATLRAVNLESFTDSTLTLGASQTFDLGTDPKLTSIDNSRILLSGGAKFRAPQVSSYSATGVHSSATLFSVEGSGTELDLSALLSFDDGGDLGWGGPQVHRVIATGGGRIDLSSVLTVTGPAETLDRLEFKQEKGDSQIAINADSLRSDNIVFVVFDPGSASAAPAARAGDTGEAALAGNGASGVSDPETAAGPLQAGGASVASGYVYWTGLGGNDADWDSAVNWSTGQVPGPYDDVVIEDLGYEFTVTHQKNTASAVRSLRSAVPLNISLGSLSVRRDSSIDGALTVTGGAALMVTGAGVTFDANGPVAVDGAHLQALSGAIINLPTATSFTSGQMTISGARLEMGYMGTINVPSLATIDNSRFYLSDGAALVVPSVITSYSARGLRNSYTLFSVEGTDTLLDLSSLESLDDGGDMGWGGGQVHSVVAKAGGTIDLSGVRTVTGPAEPQDRLDIIQGSRGTIDLGALESTVSTGQIRFAWDRAKFALLNLASAQNTTFDVPVGGSVQLPGLATHAGGAYRVPVGAHVYFPENLVGTAFTGGQMTIQGSGQVRANLTNIDNSRFFLSDGTTLAIPNVTGYSAKGLRNSDTLFSVEGTGTLLDLPRLASLDDSGPLAFGSGQFHRLVAASGGRINLSGVETVIAPSEKGDQLEFVVRDAGQIDLATSTTVLSGGSFRLENTLGTVTAGTLAVSGTGTLTAQGAIAGNVANSGHLSLAGSVSGNLLNAGQLGIGTSPGTVTVGGDYTQTAAGALILEIGGRDPGDYDQLQVTGTAALDGAVGIVMLSGAEAELSGSVPLMTFDQRIGEFAAFDGLSIRDGKAFLPSYGPHDFRLAVDMASTLGQIALGAVVSGAIDVPQFTEPWYLRIEAGETIIFDVQAITGSGQQLDFTLKRPDGTTVFSKRGSSSSPSSADHGPVSLTQAGVYTLVVDGVGDDTAGYTFRISLPDADQDGVANDVENASPNGGDGNRDGVPDGQQAHVTSLPNAKDGQYVTLAAPSGSSLNQVQATAEPPAGAPAGVAFPLGSFAYAIANVSPGAGVMLTIHWHATAGLNTFLKYGPTPDDPTPHWYPFLFDSQSATGAKIYADRIEVYYVDGLRGDDDLTANGTVVDPGTPATTAHPWQNPIRAENVNNDAIVSPSDVLTLINEINARGVRILPPSPVGDQVLPPFWDVNGDGQISPADVLVVINYINNKLAGEGEPATAPRSLPVLGTGPAAVDSNGAFEAAFSKPITSRPKIDVPSVTAMTNHRRNIDAVAGRPTRGQPRPSSFAPHPSPANSSVGHRWAGEFLDAMEDNHVQFDSLEEILTDLAGDSLCIDKEST